MNPIVVMVWYMCGHRGGVRATPEQERYGDFDISRRIAHDRMCPACTRELAVRLAQQTNERIENGQDPWDTE